MKPLTGDLVLATSLRIGREDKMRRCGIVILRTVIDKLKEQTVDMKRCAKELREVDEQIKKLQEANNGI